MAGDNQGKEEECCRDLGENCICKKEIEAAMQEGCCGGGCCAN